MNVSILRLGFRPDTGRRVDLTNGDADVRIVLTAVALRLSAVRVTPRSRACAPLDGGNQSPDVRDLVHLAQETLRARRAAERDYNVTVHEVINQRRLDEKSTSERTFSLMAGDSTRAAYDERLARGPLGRATSRAGGGSTTWTMPQEGLFLSPTFMRRLCFENAVFDADDGNLEIRFRQTDAVGDELAMSGSLIMTQEAVIREIRFGMLKQGRRIGEGTLAYSTTAFDGASFPFITQHVQQIYVEVLVPGTNRRQLHDGARIEVRYTYTRFERQREAHAVVLH
jgi:hypothetical protein